MGFYRQCKLKQGNAITVGWVDASIATKVGKLVTIEGKEGLWQIVELYGLQKREVLDAQRKAQKRWEDVIK